MAFFHALESLFPGPPERLLPVASWNHDASVYYTTNAKETEKAQPKRAKITKADIGLPSNFKHVNHVGWKALVGVDINSELELRKLLNEAGIGEEHLKDSKTSQKIFSLTEKRGGMDTVRKEAREMASSGISSPCSAHQSWPASPLVCSKPEQIRWSYLFPTCCPNSWVPACKGSCSLSAGTESPPLPPPPTSLSFNCSPSDNTGSPLSLPPPPPPLFNPCPTSTVPARPSLPAGQLSSANTAPPPPPLPPSFNYRARAGTVALPKPLSRFRRASPMAQRQAPKGKQLGIKSNKIPLDQSHFLDDIKKGIQLKSVDTTSQATQPPDNRGLIAALMEVIQKRHTAISSSGDEASEEEDDEWED